jgi:hypothetical protein
MIFISRGGEGGNAYSGDSPKCNSSVLRGKNNLCEAAYLHKIIYRYAYNENAHPVPTTTIHYTVCT